MRKSLLKLSLGLLCLGSYTASVQAQIQPLSFGTVGTGTLTNYYKDYAGSRFIVLRPSQVAGEKLHTGYGGPAVSWPNITPYSINNLQMVLAAPDSSACSPVNSSVSGKVAMVYRGNCEFGVKAKAVQDAGAVACVIVNNQANGVVGMNGGMDSTLVNIPVYMISKSDGDAIKARMALGDTVKIAIRDWGFNYADDLGIIFNGESFWHNYAIPNHELASGNGNPLAYKGADGAFVANFGTATETNVKLKSLVQFTPNGGSPTTIHQDSVSVSSFPAIDSIIVMYMNNRYDINVTGNGRVDVTYNLSEANTDMSPGDNTLSYSFYTSDSVYSKGKYDFANQKPTYADYYGGSNTAWLWGPLYFIQSAGYYAGLTQFSLETTNRGVLSGSAVVYLFAWKDSSAPVVLDSLMEKAELTLVGTATKTFSGPNDTSGATFTVEFKDLTQNNHPVLKPNTWYWVAVQVPQSPSTTNLMYLGIDGQTNYYPRIYGGNKFYNSKETWQTMYGYKTGGYSSLSTQPANTWLQPYPFDTYAYDSVNFGYQKTGLTPSVPLISTQQQGLYNVGVAPIAQRDFKVDVFPNPTSDNINITVSLPVTVKTLSYNIIGENGKFITSQERNNLQSDRFTYPTSKLASGVYYVTIVADQSSVTRKFVVINKK